MGRVTVKKWLNHRHEPFFSVYTKITKLVKGKSPPKRKQEIKGTKQNKKKSRKKLVVMPNDEEDDVEKTKSDDLSKLQIVPRLPPMDIDQVCENIRNLAGISWFKHIKYDSLDKANKENIEQEMLDMMKKFKHTPIGLGKGILEELYNKMDSKWEWELSTERQIKETTLAQTMPDLGKTCMSIDLRYFENKFVPKTRAYKILKNKIEEVV